MAHKLIFDPAIPDDLINALDYYEAISPTLANRFRSSVDQKLDDIAERPESFPIDIAPIRFVKIGRFPYLIFFAVQKICCTRARNRSWFFRTPKVARSPKMST